MFKHFIIIASALYMTSYVGAFDSLRSVSYAQSTDSYAQKKNPSSHAPISHDCTEIRILYEDDEMLTREEKIALMDKAFFDSLNQYDACQSALSKASGGGNAGKGGENAGDEGLEREGLESADGENGDGKSIASTSMSGTEAPKPITPAKDISEKDISEYIEEVSNETLASDEEESNEESNETFASDKEESEESEETATSRTKSGSVPEDIPPADNDNALAGQIRHAAMQETDPVKKAQLWNEYRKYKGLPLK